MNTARRHFTNSLAGSLLLLLLPACGLLLLFAFGLFAQELPDRIRGYKVYKGEVKASDAIFKLDDPQIVGLSIASVTLEISGQVTSLKQAGTIDFLTFKDFKVNGLQVEIQEYKEPFELKKNQTTKLPKPITISLNLAQAMRGAIDEGRQRQELWPVSGRIFIFGRFKKFGFKFKRVVPVDVNLQIKNPLRASGRP
jgi:hypothetical protein